MIEVLMVMLGGAIGALGRFIISSFIKRVIPIEFPFATLFINLIGSFLIGMLLGVHPGNLSQLLFGTGFLGGFTTFSTFEMENITLFQKKEYKKLFLYVLASCSLCILLASLGLHIGHVLKGF
ncbi:fluoride efflux transporter CrcB [Clostridium aminobutyricum]|uniref:Fluoride-specific ion channel FluC n=1 Tax=Clostridium aminobutyricum TaxID=33953 RepID=A0A939IHU4_CLOAM|nr:fluoride efflux transporter CrcB [Clostridium aminobutyricum]MBN7774222.1 fluoride efflux transporter CrcB [Clostridium aminobutyricum]